NALTVDLGSCGVCTPPPSPAAARPDHLVALASQPPRQHVAIHLITLDQQNLGHCVHPDAAGWGADAGACFMRCLAIAASAEPRLLIGCAPLLSTSKVRSARNARSASVSSFAVSTTTGSSASLSRSRI